MPERSLRWWQIQVVKIVSKFVLAHFLFLSNYEMHQKPEFTHRRLLSAKTYIRAEPFSARSHKFLNVFLFCLWCLCVGEPK